MDKICIRELTARCVLGVSEEERRERQDVIISITVYADLKSASASDGIGDALDYRALKKRVLAVVENSNFHLLETLAEAIAEMCLREDKARKVTVVVDKPGALRFARSVGVEITREKT